MYLLSPGLPEGRYIEPVRGPLCLEQDLRRKAFTFPRSRVTLAVGSPFLNFLALRSIAFRRYFVECFFFIFFFFFITNGCWTPSEGFSACIATIPCVFVFLFRSVNVVHRGAGLARHAVLTRQGSTSLRLVCYSSDVPLGFVCWRFGEDFFPLCLFGILAHGFLFCVFVWLWVRRCCPYTMSLEAFPLLFFFLEEFKKD